MTTAEEGLCLLSLVAFVWVIRYLCEKYQRWNSKPPKVVATSNSYITENLTPWPWFHQIVFESMKDRVERFFIFGPFQRKSVFIWLYDDRVYAFGDNFCGSLGLGHTESMLPNLENCLVKELTGKQVVRMAAGFTHLVALTSNGHVYTWGSNFSGQLGTGDCRNRLVPTRISTLKNIVAISCGARHTLALNTTGQVFVFGNNTRAQLGLAKLENILKPIKLDFIDNVIQIECGEWISVVLTRNNRVHVLNAETNPTMALLPLRAISVVQVAALHHSIFVRSQEGHVFRCVFPIGYLHPHVENWTKRNQTVTELVSDMANHCVVMQFSNRQLEIFYETPQKENRSTKDNIPNWRYGRTFKTAKMTFVDAIALFGVELNTSRLVRIPKSTWTKMKSNIENNPRFGCHYPYLAKCTYLRYDYLDVRAPAFSEWLQLDSNKRTPVPERCVHLYLRSLHNGGFPVLDLATLVDLFLFGHESANTPLCEQVVREVMHRLRHDPPWRSLTTLRKLIDHLYCELLGCFSEWHNLMRGRTCHIHLARAFRQHFPQVPPTTQDSELFRLLLHTVYKRFRNRVFNYRIEIV